MNYQRVKLQNFIKIKLKEKQIELRSLKGSERQRAETLIIEKAKEEFMYKNSKQKEKEVKKPEKKKVEFFEDEMVKPEKTKKKNK